MSCCLPSSKTLKSPCAKSGTNLLRRFKTVKRTSTRLTSRLKVWPPGGGGSWPAGGCWVEDCGDEEACGFAAPEEDCCAQAAEAGSKSDAARKAMRMFGRFIGVKNYRYARSAASI